MDYSTNELVEKQKISPREHIFRYIHLLPIIIIALGISFFIAYTKIRYATPIFQIKAKLLVGQSNSYTTTNDKFNDIFGIQDNTRINDQIQIIKSRSMAARVIQRLGLQTEIRNKGKFRATLVKNSEAPFKFEIFKISDSTKNNDFEVVLYDKYYTLGPESSVQIEYGQIVYQKNQVFRLNRTNRKLTDFASNLFTINWQPIESAASELSSKLDVFLATEATNVLAINLNTENTDLGIEIVNQYMSEYQLFNLEDKQETAQSALRFIDDQLNNVRNELGLVEQNLMNYRQRNKIYMPEQQSEAAFSELTESKRMLIEQRIKVRMIDYLSKYLSEEKNPDQQVSPSLGIEEPVLLPLIAEFNKLQQERALYLKTIPSGNPRIKNIESAISKVRQDLLETLKNVRITQQFLLRDLEKQYSFSEAVLNSIPEHEKQSLELARKQDILRELFQFLYEKKVETSIARASTISNIRVMESATASSGIVSPNKKNIILLAILAGLGIPTAIIFFFDYLNDKVRSRRDVQNMTSTPILGEIGHALKTLDNTLVVNQKTRTVIAEQFRIIRSNLSYILPQGQIPMILVTSTFSGEGKSFVSTNLGAVLALAGKKTVILEFDIRKPKILSGLGLNKMSKGITSFVIGKSKLEDIVVPIQGFNNLFVIPCGSIPPNPGEMMLSSKIKELFEWLKTEYDAVVIDTAPIGLVSDALVLSKFANTVAYVVRHNYTSKKQLLFLDELYKDKKLPSLTLVINDAQVSSSYGGYSYGGYGYGYGYGYGEGYYENDKLIKKWYSKYFFNKK